MSHYTVLVITDGKPTESVLAKALMPYHEFECTGKDNEYVQDVDITEETRKDYESDTATNLKAPDGTLHDPYDKQFYRDPTEDEAAKIGPFSGTGSGHGMSWTSQDWDDGKGYRAKIKFVPEGWESVEVPRKDTQSFAAYVRDWHGIKTVRHGVAPDLDDAHKYGYALLDDNGSVTKIVRRTNPNAKWDWWKLGGRWQGMLLAKRAAFSRAEVGLGSPGLMGSKHENSEAGGVDWCRVGDLDIERMKNAAVQERRNAWAEVQNKAKEHGFLTDTDALDLMRRMFTKEQNALFEAWKATDRKVHFVDQLAPDQKKVRDTFYGPFGPITTDDDIPIQDWIDAAPPLSTFAVLKDGTWYARGEMGWWAIVSDEKEEHDWNVEYEKLLRSLKPDQFVAVVDCHI